jgi:site-specific DNA recombinase
VNRRRHDVELTAQLKRKELTDVTRKLDQLIDAITEGLRAPSLQQKLDELTAKKANLESAVASAPASAPRLHPNLAEIYRRKVENLAAALQDPSTHTEALELLRGLVDRVVVHQTDSGIEVELVGEIVKMIKLSGGPESLDHEPFSSSVKVVAGACNHRQFEISVLV